jgi:hypothetical protein
VLVPHVSALALSSSTAAAVVVALALTDLAGRTAPHDAGDVADAGADADAGAGPGRQPGA